MKYIVCVKQVPATARLEFDPDTRTIRRDGVPSEVSAFDLRAVSRAVELGAATGGEVVVLTMGPPQASEALRHCLALGADRAVHLCDRAFAGADTLATAHALALAIRREAPDIILLGRHSIDAETSQVGPELAEILGLPQVTAARSLEVVEGARSFDAERETDRGFETLRVRMPAVVTVAEDIAPERFPRKAEREAAAAKPCETLSAADLGADPARVGAAGSPTWVSSLQPIEPTRLGQVIDAPTPTEAAALLASILVERHGLFSTWKLPALAEPKQSRDPVRREAPKDLWAIVETIDGALRPVSLEILGKLRTLADRVGGSVSAVVLDNRARGLLARLADAGADRVLMATADDAQNRIGVATAVLAQAIQQHAPGVLVFPSTTFGRDVAPRLAARLGIGLTSDCVDLDLDPQGRLEQLKPAFGGRFVAPILSRSLPEMATLRPGVLHAEAPCKPRPLVIEELPPPGPTGDIDSERLAFQATSDAATALDDAEVAIGIGSGLGGPDGIAAIQPLVDVLGATLCATRDVTDAGWLPRQFQVGLTGRSIGPKLYVGLGVRGAFEHMVGLQRTGIIAAINKNPKAPVFKSADYGIVGSIEDVVPPLVTALAAAARRAGR